MHERDLVDDLTEGFIDEAAEKASHKPRRKRTWYDYIMMAGAIAGALGAIGVASAWAFDQLPFPKKADIKVLNDRVAKVEGSLSAIEYSQMESLELQLTDRVQKLNDDLLKVGDTSSRQEIRRDQNALNQRLNDVHSKIIRMQGASSDQDPFRP